MLFNNSEVKIGFKAFCIAFCVSGTFNSAQCHVV
nr:MAG TPA: hypothetical protein [Inoviridae sp.]